MINLEGLDLLPEISGVPADVDHVAKAQHKTRAGWSRRRVAIIMSHDAERGLGVGLTASGCAGGQGAAMPPRAYHVRAR